MTHYDAVWHYINCVPTNQEECDEAIEYMLKNYKGGDLSKYPKFKYIPDEGAENELPRLYDYLEEIDAL